MKEFLLRVQKRGALPLALVTALFAVNLFVVGKLHLIGALLLGYVSAVIFIFLQGNRIRLSERAKISVKWHTFLGTFLRLAFLFVVLMFAVKISNGVFALMTTGFLVFYVLFYLVAIFENLRK